MVPRKCHYCKPETRLLTFCVKNDFLHGSSFNGNDNEMFNQDPFEETF